MQDEQQGGAEKLKVVIEPRVSTFTDEEVAERELDRKILAERTEQVQRYKARAAKQADLEVGEALGERGNVLPALEGLVDQTQTLLRALDRLRAQVAVDQSVPTKLTDDSVTM